MKNSFSKAFRYHTPSIMSNFQILLWKRSPKIHNIPNKSQKISPFLLHENQFTVKATPTKKIHLKINKPESEKFTEEAPGNADAVIYQQF